MGTPKFITTRSKQLASEARRPRWAPCPLTRGAALTWVVPARLVPQRTPHPVRRGRDSCLAKSVTQREKQHPKQQQRRRLRGPRL